MASREFLDRLNKLSPKQLALLALQLQERLDKLAKAEAPPIAIVGMSCRFPGNANSPEAYWELLAAGIDAIRETPRDRWDVNALFDPDPDAPGKIATRWGGFLSDLAGFDAEFFDITPREAVNLDPQQRLVLEVAWEALERAGYSPGELERTRTGVFLGLCNTDFFRLRVGNDPSKIDAYIASGSAPSVASGRISYLLGLQGPSISIDTACSSSLIAIHLACQSLRAGECSTAIAGGVNVILRPEVSMALSRAHMMASDGRCKAFDARADGFVRSEGCGLLVLKPLGNAQAAGDNILAVIRGTAANQDGRSSGITAPNGPSQEAVIRDALAMAGVKPADIDYVEAHGTGTSLGDPIEIQALHAALGEGRGQDAPLLVGSVKTNIGHLESAAGVAGLMKVVLALAHGRIPPHLHLRERNNHVDWARLNVSIPTSMTPWPAHSPRLAGVSSFGFSGTNAHIIVEEAPAHAAAAAETPEAVRTPYLLPLAAKSKAALKQLAQRYAQHLLECTGQNLSDVCYTAAIGRAHFQHRAAIIAGDRATLVERLRRVRAEEDAAGTVVGHAAAAGEVVFLYSGQGSQYPGMGRELFATEPVFRQVVTECEQALTGILAKPLTAVMFEGDRAELEQTAYLQPALFALEAGLTALWKSWGVTPSTVVGHSLGEFSAACAASVFDVATGAKLVALRGRLMQSVRGEGRMAAVMADEATVREAIGSRASEISIAAINGPTQVVISGYANAIAEVVRQLENRAIRVKMLNVSHAFHSPQMEEMLASFEAEARGFAYHEPRIDIISNVTGEFWGSAEIRDPAAYWRQHVRATTQFARGMSTLARQKPGTVVEIGPNAVLVGLARQFIPANEAICMPSLQQDRGEREQIIETVGRLYAAGVDIDWARFHAHREHRRLVLPTYPFQRKRFWDTAAVGEVANANWLYEVVWREAPRRVTSAAPSELAIGLRMSLNSPASKQGLRGYDTLSPRMESVCALFVARALEAMGITLETGQSVEASTLRTQGAVLPAFNRLFDRLLQILAEQSVLRSEGGSSWKVLSSMPKGDPVAECRQLLDSYPPFKAELGLLARCGEQLAEVLQGRQDPLQLLFPGGDTAVLESLYRDSPLAHVFNGLVREAVAGLVSCSGSRPLRILEIGAGTGATTHHVLPVLPDSAEYFFTDISTHLIVRARRAFANHPNVTCKVFDVDDKPPLEQGFVPHTFDIVIAANVLHATRYLERTVGRVVELLKPGGSLVLLEGTRPAGWADLTFGMTEGWWRFADSELRPRHALMAPDSWSQLLRKCGFSEVDSTPASVEAAGLAVTLARLPVTKEVAVDSDAQRCWIVSTPTLDAGRELAEECARLHIRCVLISRNSADDQPRAAEYVQFASDGSDAGDLLRAACAKRDPRPAAVVFLASRLSPGADPATIIVQDTLAASHWMRAVSRVQGGPRLWVATSGAQPVDGVAPVNGGQAGLWGWARVASLEHPDMFGAIVDTDTNSSLAEALADSIENNGSEDQTGWRNGRRFFPRLIRAENLSADPFEWRSDRSYLVTGWMGDLGLLLVRWLADRGVRHLVLIGRRSLTGERTEASDVIADLEGRGVTVTTIQANVADAQAMGAAFARFGADLLPLAGLFHLAADMSSRTIEELDAEACERMVAAKVTGGWLLDRLTSSMQLDCFVLFSTWAAVVGAYGFAHYAAASTALESLAHTRRAHGLAAVAINWGMWERMGGGASAEDRAFFESSGLRRMPAPAALELMELALGRGQPQCAIASIDWDLQRPVYESRRQRPFLQEIDVLPVASSRTSPAEPVRSQGWRLDKLPEASRAEALVELVRAEVAEVIGLAQPSEVELTRGLFEMGMDSLMVVELRARLERRAGHELPATLTFNYPNVTALAKFLGKLLLTPAAAPTQRAAPSAVPAATTFKTSGDDLSEDELERLLAEKLKAI